MCALGSGVRRPCLLDFTCAFRAAGEGPYLLECMGGKGLGGWGEALPAGLYLCIGGRGVGAEVRSPTYMTMSVH